MKGQFGEPWETTVGGDWIILKDDGSNVAHCRGATPHNTVRAARIVACVNAMNGIPDPVDAVERAREALKEAVTWFEAYAEHAEHGQVFDLTRARAALAALGDGK